MILKFNSKDDALIYFENNPDDMETLAYFGDLSIEELEEIRMFNNVLIDYLHTDGVYKYPYIKEIIKGGRYGKYI